MTKVDQSSNWTVQDELEKNAEKVSLILILYFSGVNFKIKTKESIAGIYEYCLCSTNLTILLKNR